MLKIRCRSTCVTVSGSRAALLPGACSGRVTLLEQPANAVTTNIRHRYLVRLIILYFLAIYFGCGVRGRLPGKKVTDLRKDAIEEVQK